MRIGAHVRTSKGLVTAVEYARSVGCEAIQVFAKSPLQWHAASRAQDDAEAFRLALARADIVLAATHGAYLINLASTDDALWSRSCAALADEIARAEQIGAPAVVTHLGSSTAPRTDACRRAAAALTEALARTAGCGVGVYLENSAGSGDTLGSSAEEVVSVYLTVPADLRARLAVCIDTCHAHVAGYDLTSDRGWRELLTPFARSGARIGLVHANDAMFECGSRRDRHAWIGDGTIGDDGFARMFARAELRDADVIVEMPGEPPAKDAINVARLKAFREQQRMPRAHLP